MTPSVQIFDTTLRDGLAAPNFALSPEERFKIASQLDLAGVDVIEAGYALGKKQDLAALRAIAPVLLRAIACGLASSSPDDIDAIGVALERARHGRINTYASTRLRRTTDGERVLAEIHASVSRALNWTDDVQWTAMDSTRSDRDFLCRAVETAIHSGATTVCLADTVGISTPLELTELVTSVSQRVPNISQARIAVHCHDDLGRAVVNSIAAVEAGASQIECTLNGLGPQRGNAHLEQIIARMEGKHEVTTAIVAKLSEFIERRTNSRVES
ncbi:MAG: hypothetical protein AAGB13_10635 [Cyanobacteria bacterium P01_F01_bin.33]